MAGRRMGLRPGETCDPGCEPGARLSVQERANTTLSICSQAAKDEMAREDAFINSITGRPNTKVFTQRGAPPMRKDLIP